MGLLPFLGSSQHQPASSILRKVFIYLLYFLLDSLLLFVTGSFVVAVGLLVVEGFPKYIILSYLIDHA